MADGRSIAQIKIWIVHDELLLDASVETLLLRHQVIAEAVVKHSKAGPQHSFGRILGRAANAPSNSHPRRKVGMIGNVVLSFKTETITEGEIGTDAPVILGVQAGVKPIHANSIAAINQILNSLSIRQAHH